MRKHLILLPLKLMVVVVIKVKIITKIIVKKG